MSKTLKERISQAGSSFNQLTNSLPTDVKPCAFSGFGDPRPEKEVVLRGWDYDWSDKGSDPPPWSDWPDKTE
ncbi:MAG: hypothetical protein M1324_00835 [Patescibacteria group bacterium]|nr:hypothetical protein [Patescibacteria group bacterium]